LKKIIFCNIFSRSALLKAKRLEPRLGPTEVGPNLSSSLFANVKNTDRSVSPIEWVEKDHNGIIANTTQKGDSDVCL